MAFTGIGELNFPHPFGNPSTDLADDETVYSAMLMGDRRSIQIRAHPGDRLVATHGLPDDSAQSASLFARQGRLCIGVTCLTGSGRKRKLFDTGIALSGSAPPPPPQPGPASNAELKAQIVALVAQIV